MRAASLVAAALTARTKAVILCSPSNPTGAAYTEAELRALADVLRPHDCWIVTDEIYGALVYDGFVQRSILAVAPDLVDRVVIIDGASKTFAMTGWRVGWSIAPAPLAKAMDTIQGQGATSTATFSQWAAIEALRSPPTELARMRALFEERRDRLVAGLRLLPGVRCGMPEGAFYAFPDVSAWLGKRTPMDQELRDDTDVAAWLLDATHVAVVPGSAFCAPGHLRLSYAVSVKSIDEALRRIAGALTTVWDPTTPPFPRLRGALAGAASLADDRPTELRVFAALAAEGTRDARLGGAARRHLDALEATFAQGLTFTLDELGVRSRVAPESVARTLVAAALGAALRPGAPPADVNEVRRLWEAAILAQIDL